MRYHFTDEHWNKSSSLHAVGEKPDDRIAVHPNGYVEATIENPPGHTRAELSLKSVDFREDIEYTVTVCLKPEDKPSLTGELVTQIHARPDVGETWRPPIFALEIHGDDWVVAVRGDDRKIMTGKPRHSTWNRVAPVSRGEWVTFTISLVLSHAGNGYVTVDMDGVRIYGQNGCIGYNDDRPAYLKAGIYKWPWPNHAGLDPVGPRTVLIREVSVTSAA